MRACWRTLAAIQAPKGKVLMYVVYEKLIQHLNEHNIKYRANSDDRSIWANFCGKVGAYQIVARVNEDPGVFRVYGNFPVDIPRGARSSIAETIIRANYGLQVGRFEMDFDNGHLRFHMGQILTSNRLEAEIIELMIQLTIEMLDRYLPAILSVIYGNEHPQDAIRHVEWALCDDEERPELPDDIPF